MRLKKYLAIQTGISISNWEKSNCMKMDLFIPT
ncbi:Uncharacterised protein [uncultured Clostridium sp.]|nr:Uncharacterised protein [uncultured Clostridium sp.]